MKRKFLAIIFSLLFSQFLLAQLKYKGLDTNIGFGYKSNISTFGIGIGACLGDNLELIGSTSMRFLGGFGFSGGPKYNFIPQKKKFPSLQFSYRFLFPAKPDIG